MLLREYWGWVGGNIGAMPLEALISAIAAVLLQRPIRRLLAWLRRERTAMAAEALEEARKARLIAADLYLHVTGAEHPHAPERKE